MAGNILKCSYFNGMFSNDPESPPSIFSIASELENACHHETGHAVLGYVFGYSVTSLGVCSHYGRNVTGEPTVAFSGLVEFDKRRFGLFSNVVAFPYRFAHFREGVITAAGPAAERRIRFEKEEGQRLLGASENDHQQISEIGRFLERRGRSRYAYQEHVWNWAQRAVSNDAIWSAICDAAEWLYENACADQWDGEGTPMAAEVWSKLSPADLYSACRRHGLRKGMYARGAVS